MLKKILLFTAIVAICAALSAQERPSTTQADYDRWLGNCTATANKQAEYLNQVLAENAALKAENEKLKTGTEKQKQP